MRRNQNVMQNQYEELDVKPYPKKKIKQKTEQPEIDFECPIYKQKRFVEFDKGYFCQNFQFFVNNQKNQIDEKST